jgi:glutathione peroxidase
MLTNCAVTCRKVQQAALIDTGLLNQVQSWYDLSAHDIQGNVIDFETLRNHVVVITNVASYCGYTDEHYTQLVQLHTQLVETQHLNVTILAFPCNQFGQQEPGTPTDIQHFVTTQKSVPIHDPTFQIMEKIKVNGPEAHLVYKYLKQQTNRHSIGWNFATYFIIAPHTGAIEAYDGVEPMELVPDILELLPENNESTTEGVEL